MASIKLKFDTKKFERQLNEIVKLLRINKRK